MEKILEKIDELAIFHNKVSPKLVKEKGIKLGLRNEDGSGVPVGITSKGTVLGYVKEKDNIKATPIEGKLLYCGFDTTEYVNNIFKEGRFGFEEITYLLLSGELPTRSDLKMFTKSLAKRRPLGKLEKMILLSSTENDNQMYALHSMISNLSRLDKNPDSHELQEEMHRSMNLIAKMPTIVASNYNILQFKNGNDLKLIQPDPTLSTAENFLYMLHGKRPTEFEAHLFDIALVLHAEHGGGNNSTFTVRTVSSSGANTYMAIASGIASLSGHLHGGANEAVEKMMKDIKKNITNWESEKEIAEYLEKILDKKVGDKTGKIYGMGHAVYTLSDPRAIIFREKAYTLAQMKNAEKEFNLYVTVADTAARLLKQRKGAPINPNVDFYSGFVYKHMGIPAELFTPIFAMARVVGWVAHRIEQIMQGKIMRPAYVSSLPKEEKYVPIDNRKE